MACDITDPDAVARLFEKVTAEQGPVEVLVANAGITRDALLLSMADHDVDEVLDTNLRAVIRLAKHGSRGMLAERWGRLVLVSSSAAFTGSPGSRRGRTARRDRPVPAQPSTAVARRSSGPAAGGPGRADGSLSARANPAARWAAAVHRRRRRANWTAAPGNGRARDGADWATESESNVTYLRFISGNHRHDPRLAELIGELTIQSEEFAALWCRQRVANCIEGTKLFSHPVVGELELMYQSADLQDGNILKFYHAEPDSPHEAALQLLTVDLNSVHRR